MINVATLNGARKAIACKTLGLSIRTVQRWYHEKSGQLFEDARPNAIRPTPTNKLSPKETALILKTCNEEEFASYPPGYIVPTLADDNRYIGSESTFYRVLKKAGQLADRSLTKSNKKHSKPEAQIATKPNELWSWDISYLATQTRGQHYYLYLIVDIFSRKIVGADVYDRELGELAADFLQRTIWSEKCVNKGTVLHSDNGAPMRSFTMQAKMRDLGVASSYSRPRVSNDNLILNHSLEQQNTIIRGLKMVSKIYQKRGAGSQTSLVGTTKYINTAVLNMSRQSNDIMAWIANCCSIEKKHI